MIFPESRPLITGKELMTEDEQLMQKRFLDLSRQADYKGIVTFSDFLGLNEQNIFRQTEGMLSSGFQMSGGYEYAERQMVAFCPDALYYEWNYPFTCLKIEPAYPKFSDTLGHRDILGAVMNLGIERSKIGDILIRDNTAYHFCMDSVRSYILEQLEKIKHTVVKITETDAGQNPDIRPEFEHLSGIITSNRLDALVACICKLSRSAAASLITSGKVCINGRETLHNTYVCRAGDILSVRSYGKYIFDAVSGETKKGRMKIDYRKYK